MESKKQTKKGSEEPRGRTGRKMQTLAMDLRLWGVGGGSGGMNWEIGIDIYTLICIK